MTQLVKVHVAAAPPVLVAPLALLVAPPEPALLVVPAAISRALGVPHPAAATMMERSRSDREVRVGMAVAVRNPGACGEDAGERTGAAVRL
jgi:hypothetical protein